MANFSQLNLDQTEVLVIIHCNTVCPPVQSIPHLHLKNLFKTYLHSSSYDVCIMYCLIKFQLFFSLILQLQFMYFGCVLIPLFCFVCFKYCEAPRNFGIGRWCYRNKVCCFLPRVYNQRSDPVMSIGEKILKALSLTLISKTQDLNLFIYSLLIYIS